MVNRILVLLCLLCLTLPVLGQTSTQVLSAFVDRNEVSLSDILTLTIRVDNSLGNSRPSLVGLNRDFERIGNISTRSSYTNINGAVQSFVDYILQIRPLSTGALIIPAFRIGSEVTNPIRITVGESDQLSNIGNDEIFIFSEVSKEQVYVQEQLLYTIKLYYSISFDQGAQLTSPQVADSVLQQLGSDETYSEIVEGVRYNVTERKFVIFPQSSGELIIPPVYFTATVGRRGGLTRFFNNRTSVREINLTSDIHAIDVQSKPVSFPGQTWLPAANVSIVESWSGPLDSLEIGESVTRNVQLTTSGLSSSLLPGISYEEIDGLKLYPDQPEREDSANELGVTGSRTEGIAIVPSEAGDFIIPEMVIPWWNTVTDSLELAIIPARTLSVLIGSTANMSSPDELSIIPLNDQAFSAPSNTMTATKTSGLYLFWISSTAIFSVAWVFSTSMWLHNRRLLAFMTTATPAMMPQQKTSKVSSVSLDRGMALKVLKTAIDKGKAGEIKRCLVTWGQAFYQDMTVLTLTQLEHRVADERFDALLFTLEQSLYRNHENNNKQDGDINKAEFNKDTLYKFVSQLHKKGNKRKNTKQDYGLPPLYKN